MVNFVAQNETRDCRHSIRIPDLIRTKIARGATSGEWPPAHFRLSRHRLYMLHRRMAHELDDIRAQTECPNCGIVISVSYKTLRLARTVECHGCGETISLIDDTPISTIQKLIDNV